MATSDIYITLKLITVEPDGSRCLVCDDVIFLKAWRYAIQTRKELIPISHLICDSCKEMVT